MRSSAQRDLDAGATGMAAPSDVAPAVTVASVPPAIWQAIIVGSAALGGAIAYATGFEAVFPQQASAAVLLTVFVAATLSSIVGFAFSLICAAALIHLVGSPVSMMAMLIVASIGIQLFCTWTLRRELDWRGTLPFLAGGVATLPLGQLILRHLPGHTYAVVLGGLLVAYTLWTLLRPTLPVRQGGMPAALLIGAAGGITGGLVAAPALALAVGGGILGWSRTRQRSIMQPFILLMQVAALMTMSMLAPDPKVPSVADPALLAVLPPALLGAVCGMWVHRRLSDCQFARAVTLLLLTTGMALIALGAGRSMQGG